jgi:N,N'-diacetyllegionaminate synthase
MKIGNREVTKKNLFFVVEEGQFHEGHLTRALQMVEQAAGTGADAIEFQLAIADDFYVKSHPGHAIYKRREFSETQLKEIASCCKLNGIELVVAPFSPLIVRRMARFGCSAFNINASDLNNPSMLRTVAETGLPFFMSLPLATPQEVEWACNYVGACGNFSPNFILLHGQHSMASGEGGVAPVDTSLGFLQTIKQEHNGLAGFIDHTPLPWFPACAAAAGANVITKHMTPSHRERGPDWQICLEPTEMKAAIQAARDVLASITQTAKVLAPGENLDRTEMRRSIVYSADLSSGHRIEAGDLSFKRPGDGISPDQFPFLIGRELAVPVKQDEKVLEAQLR